MWALELGGPRLPPSILMCYHAAGGDTCPSLGSLLHLERLGWQSYRRDLAGLSETVDGKDPAPSGASVPSCSLSVLFISILCLHPYS